jgi:hypothetical protein
VRTHRATVLFGVLAAGLVLTQQACTPSDRRSNAPVAFTAPTEASTQGTSSKSSSGTKPSSGTKASGGTKTPTAGKKSKVDPILAGKRQIVITPIPSYESIVVVDDSGRLSLTDGEAEHSMFVLTPVGDKYLIKTAKAGAGGEPSCMGIKGNGSAPLTVVAAACDAGRAGQLFTIARQEAKSNGLPTYAISNRSAFLQEFPSGLIAEELGDAPLKTTFAFVDNGPSTLPSLD